MTDEREAQPGSASRSGAGSAPAGPAVPTSVAVTVIALLVVAVLAAAVPTPATVYRPGEVVEVGGASGVYAVSVMVSGRVPVAVAAIALLEEEAEVSWGRELPMEVVTDSRLVMPSEPEGAGASAALPYELAAGDRAPLRGGTGCTSPVVATGVVNHRGEVLPVGGIPAKGLAAAGSGAEVLVVPAGQGGAVDAPVDVVEARSVDEAAEKVRARCRGR